MTKKREIEILQEAAEKLGADSYCGPWLREQIPQVDMEIRDDILPGNSGRVYGLQESYKEAARIIAEARHRAQAMLDDAHKQVLEAKKSVDQLNVRAWKLAAELDRIKNELRAI